MGVFLGRGQTGVTEEFLDGAQVGPGLEQVGGKAVAQRVGAGFQADAAGAGVVRHNAGHAAGGQTSAATVEKDGRTLGGRGLAARFLGVSRLGI